jgi:hypothetical protein
MYPGAAETKVLAIMRLRLQTSLIATSLCLSAGFAIAPPGVAHADAGSVTLNQTETRKTLFVAGQVDRLADIDVDGKIATAIELLGWEVYQQNPELGVSLAENGMRFTEEAVRIHFEGVSPDIRDSFLTQATELQILEVLRDATEGMNYFEPAARKMVQDALVQEQFDSEIGDYGLNVTGDQSDAMRDVVLDPKKVLGKVFDEALTNPTYADFRDATFGAKDGVSVKDSAAEMLAKDPQLAGQQVLKDAVKADGTMTIGKETAKNAANTAIDKANGQTTTTIDNTGKIIDAGERVRSAKTDAERAQAQKDLEAAKKGLAEDKAEREKLLKDSKTALTGLTLIIEQFDPEAADAINEVGSTIIKGAQIFNTFANTASSVATNLATGNYVGVVMDVFSLVTGMNDLMKTPEQQATEALKKQVEKLGQNIADFRKEANARFDRIDKALNTIYTELNTQFAKLEDMVGQVGADVDRVMDDVVKTQARLDAVGARIYNAMSDAANRNLWTSINTAIGWQERSPGGKQMTADQFSLYAGEFSTHATTSAYDAAALPTDRGHTDDELTSALAFSLERNVDFLRAYPQQELGLDPIASSPLPNPRDWTVAARAFSQLLLENPNYMTAGQDARLTAVMDGGKRLQAAIRRIGTADTDQGTKSALLNGLLAKYRAAATDVQNRIVALETGYQNRQKAKDDSALAMDYWAGPDQAPKSKPTITQAGNLALPSNASLDAMVPVAVINAWRMYGGALTPSISGEWVNLHDEVVTDKGNENYYGSLRVTVSWTWNSPQWGAINVASRSRTFDEEILCQIAYDWDGNETSNSCPGPTASSSMSGGWTAGAKYKAGFEAGAGAISTNTDTLAKARSAVSDKLVEHQKAMYAEIATEMKNGGTDVAKALNRLTGVKDLVTQFIQFGLPAAYDANAELRALLVGNDRLFDNRDNRMQALYETASKTPPAPNYRGLLLSETFVRATALEGYLKGAVKAASGTRRVADAALQPTGSDLVDTTMARLSLTRFVLTGPKGNTGAPKPGTDGPTGDEQTPPSQEQPPAAVQPQAPQATTPVAPAAPRGQSAPSTAPAKLTITGVTGTARKGLTVSLSARVAATVQVTIDAKTAKRLKLGKVVGTGKGTGKVVVKLSAKAAKRLRGAKVTVRITAGNTTATRVVTLK